MLARAYLRASTNERDASRAKAQVEAFAAERGLTIVGTYAENESDAKLARPRAVPPPNRLKARRRDPH